MGTASQPRGVPRSFAAVDLGASSGRVIVGTVGSDRLDLTEVYRFDNGPVTRSDGLHWNIEHIIDHVQTGIRKAASSGEIRTVGIDSWAVDYGLIGEDGALLVEPYHYRDPRGARGMATVHRRIDAGTLYHINGLQQLPINTVYQLAAEDGDRLGRAACILMIPDLIGYRLTGARITELTNASTTGLLDATSRTWSDEIVPAAGLRRDQLRPVAEPGTDIGSLRRQVRDRIVLPAVIRLVTVASHDTASAVAAIPAIDHDVAYISCGTWALVGVELQRPLISDAARDAGFTNEVGVDGTVRFLRNVTGLWVLQETLRGWRAAGMGSDLPALLTAAAALPSGGPVIDINAAEFLPPGGMAHRIHAACERAGMPPPDSPRAVVRCILDSLAAAIARAVRDVVALTGRRLSALHLVGGGARNRLLCQLVADAAELPLFAGPVEATAIGNLLVQARADGVLSGDLLALRDLVRRTHAPDRYRPRRLGSTPD